MRANSLWKLVMAASLLIAPAVARAQGMTPAPQSPPPQWSPPPGPTQAPPPAPTQAPQSAPTQSPPPAPQPWAQASPWGAPQPLPPPPAPPASAIAPNGEYVAPMAQTTQPVYVPQSVALSGPRFIKDWEPGQPIPYGYHAENQVRKGPIIAGSVLFGVFYGLSSFSASVGQDSSSGRSNPVASLYIPVIGPFAQLFQTHSATGDYFLVVDGGAQAAGVILFIYGMTSPRPLLVRNDLAFTVAPMKLGRDGNGLGFVGRF